MKVLAVVGLIACLASLPALADCIEPQDTPQLPDGATASREDMVSAQKTIKAYDIAVKEFAQCVHKDGGSTINLDRASRAVNTVIAIADKFNAELRAFKKKNGA